MKQFRGWTLYQVNKLELPNLLGYRRPAQPESHLNNFAQKHVVLKFPLASRCCFLLYFVSTLSFYSHKWPQNKLLHELSIRTEMIFSGDFFSSQTPRTLPKVFTLTSSINLKRSNILKSNLLEPELVSLNSHSRSPICLLMSWLSQGTHVRPVPKKRRTVCLMFDNVSTTWTKHKCWTRKQTKGIRYTAQFIILPAK